MVNVPQRLAETNVAIALLKSGNIAIPAEAIEMQEIMHRCVVAEQRVRELQGATRPVTHPLAEDKTLADVTLNVTA